MHIYEGSSCITLLSHVNEDILHYVFPVLRLRLFPPKQTFLVKGVSCFAYVGTFESEEGRRASEDIEKGMWEADVVLEHLLTRKKSLSSFITLLRWGFHSALGPSISG